MNLTMILLIWLTTIIASFTNLMKLAKEMIKDFADAGYLFDIRKTENLESTALENSDLMDITTAYMLIPGKNLIDSLKTMRNYYINKEEFFNTFKVLGVIYPMSEEDEHEYKKNPTAYNAFNIATNNQKRNELYERVRSELQKHNISEKDINNEENEVSHNNTYQYKFDPLTSQKEENNEEVKTKNKTLKLTKETEKEHPSKK